MSSWRRSDVVSLHLPLTDATRGMVNREFLAKMRPGAYLVNTSRGGLIVETDLREALISGHITAAGLDVLNHEPPEPGNPLLGSAQRRPQPAHRRHRHAINARNGRAGGQDDRRSSSEPLAG